jgi:hypothetical protein
LEEEREIFEFAFRSRLRREPRQLASWKTGGGEWLDSIDTSGRISGKGVSR